MANRTRTTGAPAGAQPQEQTATPGEALPDLPDSAYPDGAQPLVEPADVEVVMVGSSRGLSDGEHVTVAYDVAERLVAEGHARPVDDDSTSEPAGDVDEPSAPPADAGQAAGSGEAAGSGDDAGSPSEGA